MFFIRADGNAQVGSGHIMRCLTIAEEIKKLDTVEFLCADKESAALVERSGFIGRVLAEVPFSEAELVKLAGLVQKLRESVSLLIDSYTATAEYVKAAAGLCRVICMDDMGRQVFPADVMINYNIYAKQEQYEALYAKAAKKPLFLLGNRFVPVRRQFQDRKYTVNAVAGNLLLTTGGGDVDNLAGEILKALKRHPVTGNLHVHVVSGAFNPHYETLMKQAGEENGVTVYKNVQDMAELMSRCELAITAGGSTIYELCALGVPFVCFAYVKNQEEAVSYFAEHGIAKSAGYMEGNTIAKIVALTAELASSADLRRECYEKERKLVDGLGAERLAERLCGDRVS